MIEIIGVQLKLSRPKIYHSTLKNISIIEEENDLQILKELRHVVFNQNAIGIGNCNNRIAVEIFKRDGSDDKGLIACAGGVSSVVDVIDFYDRKFWCRWNF